jgi:LacI family transcriptional regulator
MVDRDISGIRVPSFCFDNRRGMKLAWLHLWNLGRKPIVYVDFKKDVSTVQARREGIRDAHLEAGLRWDDKFHVKALGTLDGTGLNQELIRQALEIAKGGGAILTATDLIAFAIIRMNLKLKIAMPEEVALVGFEDEVMLLKERVGWITSPPLTTVRMHFDQIGSRATEFLLDFMEKPKDTRNLSDNNKVFLIEPQLVVRESCGGQPGIYGFDKNNKICFLGEEDS